MTPTHRDDDALVELLQFMKQERGFDFTGYKRSTLERRIRKRMQIVGDESYREYLVRLRTQEGEYVQLFNTILINVTDFFRDEVPWDYIAGDIIPTLIERRGREQIRVWSAGCATGQEAYSLAMLFAEALGAERLREQVKIYATDVDEEALALARAGTYTEKEIERVPPELLERYFDRRDGRFAFRKDLRRVVIFGRNDLVQDAPISRIDLLVCRNTLMYFDAETQTRILGRFHFALREGGCLFLGRAETLLSHLGTFAPIDLKRRLFTKVSQPSLDDRLLQASRRSRVPNSTGGGQVMRLRDAALSANIVPQIIVDRAGVLVVASEAARTLFRVGGADIGRPLQDLELSYRPAELRSAIAEAYEERHSVVREEVEWRSPDGEQRWLDVHVTPLYDAAGESLGASVSFVDVTAVRRLETQLHQSNQELETAYEELQSTNEELETTNEELQSTVEELETTNEELQSTNEELETMNEELQATNEELQTMNDELRRRGDELNEVNDFLESVFTSVRAGVVVLDRDLTVLVWNSGAEDLWGLRNAEVEGTPLLNLDIGFPVEQLKQPLRACLAGELPSFEHVVAATSRRGKAITCRVGGTPLVGRAQEPVPRGVILFMTAEDVTDGAGAGERSGSASASSGAVSAD